MRDLFDILDRDWSRTPPEEWEDWVAAEEAEEEEAEAIRDAREWAEARAEMLAMKVLTVGEGG